MSPPDHSVREQIFIQKQPFKFHMKPYAPKDGIPRFGIDVSAYVTGAGWEELDHTVAGNDFMIHYLKFIRDQEFLGYQHIGISATELLEKLEKLWGQKEEDWG